MNEQIQRIKGNHQKILQLSEEKLTRVFGAGKHRFKLNPPATQEQVLEYEQKYQFNFPEGYRLFILEVGDGGAGPFYGIKQRFTVLGATVRHEEARHFNKESIYKAPCPSAENWKSTVIGPNYEEVEDRNESIYFQGNMAVFEVGSGIVGVLVLNGPMAGTVCITDYGYSPYTFWQPPQFLDVYESWQEAVLYGSEDHGFGF